MGTHLAFDNHDIQRIATPMGWQAVVRWSYNLPVDEFPLVCHLIKYGYSDHIYDLSQQFQKASRYSQIHDPSLKSTIKGIVDLIKKNEHSARLVIVSNGMVPSRRKFTNKR